MIIHPSSPPPPSQPPSWSRPFLIDSNLSISCIFCYESILLTDIILCCCIQPLECAILALTPAHLQELVETAFKKQKKTLAKKFHDFRSNSGTSSLVFSTKNLHKLIVFGGTLYTIYDIHKTILAMPGF